MNKKKKILVSFGTRPEAIKMAPVVLELQSRDNFDVIVCSTGQHDSMLKDVLDYFHIKANYDLSIMKDNQSLFDISTNILLSVRDVLINESPDIVLVHGDTSTTFLTSLACYYLRIPVGHVEAGLRTNNIYSPFPEEFNRQAVSIISKFNFAPTERAKENLIHEGTDPSTIFVTGNTVIDAMKYTVKEDYSHSEIVWAKGSKLIFVTAHRRENLGLSMDNMFNAIKTIVEQHDDIKVLYPVHLNPRIRNHAKRILGNNSAIHLCEPLNVFECHNIISKSFLVLTDSGGLQEEAPSLNVPVLVMRDTTERPEGVENGTLKLVGTKKDSIVNAVDELIKDKSLYNKMVSAINPYGDGTASKKIAEILSE